MHIYLLIQLFIGAHLLNEILEMSRANEADASTLKHRQRLLPTANNMAV